MSACWSAASQRAAGEQRPGQRVRERALHRQRAVQRRDQAAVEQREPRDLDVRAAGQQLLRDRHAVVVRDELGALDARAHTAWRTPAWRSSE